MLHEFLDENRGELIERCRAKVAKRRAPRPSLNEMEHGIPRFLDQLIQTMRLEQESGTGSRSQDRATRGLQSEISASATLHGHELLQQGLTVNQVVHGYGDLCQAVTELATESNAPVTADEFHTFNRLLDNAIADAVTEFDRRRDRMISDDGDRAMGERLGFLAHELRNHLNTAMLSFAAIKLGTAGIHGATSAVLDRSLAGLRGMVDRVLTDVRLASGEEPVLTDVAVDDFIANVEVAASLEAASRHCELTVFTAGPGLTIHVDAPLLYSAVSNLLQNAFKFTREHGHVTLSAQRKGDRVLIEVADQCGGLPEGLAKTMFESFKQGGVDRSGLGLGLSIARRAVEACGGLLKVRDLPGQGCVFAIDLPCRAS